MVPSGYKTLRLPNQKRNKKKGAKLWKLQHQGGLTDFRETHWYWGSGCFHVITMGKLEL